MTASCFKIYVDYVVFILNKWCNHKRQRDSVSSKHNIKDQNVANTKVWSTQQWLNPIITYNVSFVKRKISLQHN